MSAVSGWGQKVSAAGSVISMFRAGNPQWTGQDYAALAEAGFKKCVVSYRCVHLLASSMAAVNWTLKDGDKELDSHELLDLLHQPNPWQGGSEFFEASHAYELLSGSQYIEQVFVEGEIPRGEIEIPGIGAKPLQLFTLRPDRTRIIPSTVGTPAGYVYGASGSERRWLAAPFSNDSAIIHCKRFNPLDDFYGMSPLCAAAYAVDQHNMAGRWNMSLLQNSGRPSGALVYAPKGNEGAEMPDSMFKRIKQELQSHHQGQENAGKAMVLDGGLSWVQMAMSPADMDWINGKHVSAREICLAFGVPPYLMGIPGDATYNNYKEARQGMYEDTVLPLLDRYIDKLNNTLVRRFDPSGKRLKLGYDEDSIPALAPKRAEKWTAVQNADWLTINEKREATGYDPIEGPAGDEIMVQSSMVPLSLAGDPKSELNAPQEDPNADPNTDPAETDNLDKISRDLIYRALIKEGWNPAAARKIADLEQKADRSTRKRLLR